MRTGPETFIRRGEVLCGHTRIDVCGVGSLEASIAEVSGETVVVLLNDAPFFMQVQSDIDKRAVSDAIPTLASETSVRIKDNGFGYVGASVCIQQLVPVGLIARIVALISENILMGVHEVTMPWKKGALERIPLT